MKRKYQIYSMSWEYEQDLPEMTDLEYDHLFLYSRLEDGVRMFPYIDHFSEDGKECSKIYLGA